MNHDHFKAKGKRYANHASDLDGSVRFFGIAFSYQRKGAVHEIEARIASMICTMAIGFASVLEAPKNVMPDGRSSPASPASAPLTLGVVHPA
jgi:hypothetical protein